MPVSYVLRLNVAALSAGRLAGEVELVETGERSSFRDSEELVSSCVALSPSLVPPPRNTPSAQRGLSSGDT